MDWIKASDRLPKEGLMILLHTQWGEILIGDLRGEDFYSDHGDFLYVTHWMSLPPKPELTK